MKLVAKNPVKKQPLESGWKDTLKIQESRISLNLNFFSGMQGDFWVLYAPAVGLSGYGKTVEEATDFFYTELEVFCEDLLEMKQQERENYLHSQGFSKENFPSNTFTRPYVDEDLRLQEFDEGTLVHKILETA